MSKKPIISIETDALARALFRWENEEWDHPIHETSQVLGHLNVRCPQFTKVDLTRLVRSWSGIAIKSVAEREGYSCMWLTYLSSRN
jgi:hypothetical protein